MRIHDDGSTYGRIFVYDALPVTVDKEDEHDLSHAVVCH